MRYLGIDFGIKRVGLALSDTAGTLAFPLQTIVRTTRRELFDRLLECIEQNKIDAVVLGIPYGLDGQTTPSTRQALNFRDSLSRRISRPILTIDESFSTSEAVDLLRETGKKPFRGEIVDHLAAAVILQRFLDDRDGLD
ncbi:MAG: Holliday junction resolvase RuvX [Thermodesulfobacteriota bacterium]